MLHINYILITNKDYREARPEVARQAYGGIRILIQREDLEPRLDSEVPFEAPTHD